MAKRISAVAALLFSSLSIFVFTSFAVAQSFKVTSVRLVPTGISITSDNNLPQEVRDIEADGLKFAFDRNTSTELVLFETAKLAINLESGAEVSELRVLAPAPYTLSAAVLNGNENSVAFSPSSAVQGVDLSVLSAGWHSVSFGADVQTNAVELTLTPVAGGAGSGLPEVEIWGPGQTARAESVAAVMDILGEAHAAGPFRRLDVPGAVLVFERKPTDVATFTLDYAPEDIRRAWLSYEVRGVHSWLAVRRAINGNAGVGGYIAAADNTWSAQLEEISPEQLMRGENTLTFGTLKRQEHSYTLRGLSVVVELDDGQHLVAGGNLVTDGDPMTSRKILADTDGVARTELALARFSAVDALELTFEAAPVGLLTVEAMIDDRVETVIADVDPNADPRIVANGTSYVIDLGGVNAEALAVSLTSHFKIVEADASGSPAGLARDPEGIALTWPVAGEYFGRTGFLRGHILPSSNASGPAKFVVAGLPFKAPDGVFEVAISKDQAGFGADDDSSPWSVEIVALYPDGTTVVQNVVFDNPQFIDGLSTYTTGVLSEMFSPSEDRTVTHEEAELTIVAGALSEAQTIQISALTEIELASLDAGLVNVTKGPRRGYRMLPHTRFNASNRLRLPFAPSRIPLGYTAEDVRIFYFDEEAGRWIALDNTDVDTVTTMVAADTDHFTDFIAGVVVAPESPQVASYNPTQLKDMKVADPSARINLIAAPQATNTGDAGLSYPLELPPGRQGLAPRLGLQYSSGGGNGWMGLGWNIAMQEVSIDTRWGVPRYSDTDETETYLWSGQQLTPLAHRGNLVPREAERVFHTRVEGGFNRIVRHGDNPTNYWWEVTDKMGTRYAYGGNLDTGAQDGSAVLTDGDGNVFKWALTEIRDTNGNLVTYDYVTVTDVGLSQGSVPGTQLYVAAIQYTGHTNTGTGPFEVRFVRDRDLGEPTRNDVIIDGRGGFKMVTADLLRRVEVTYNDILVRAYEFNYAEGAFYKQLLQSVTQLDTRNQPFNTHTFEYFDDARDASGAYRGFAPAIDWQAGADEVSLDAFFGSMHASVLNGVESDQANDHLYIGLAPTGYRKKDSIGGVKTGSSESTTTGRIQLIDLNGDGLADKLFMANDGRIFMRANESGPSGESRFGTVLQISLPAISQDSSTGGSWGAEGYRGISFGFNDSQTTSESAIYFTDANGDGLPDLNFRGNVFFNVLNDAGLPTFILNNSGESAYPVGPAAVQADLLDANFDTLLQQLIDNAPLADNLRAWTAPYPGTVQINGDLALIADTSTERAEYETADGVRATIELNGVQLFVADIAPDDYASKSPALVPVAVAKGDVIYFRVQSRYDGAFDQVSWAPEITYTDIPAGTDPNGLPVETYAAADDLILFSDLGGAIAPAFDGTLRLAGTLEKTATTTDNVVLEIVKNGIVFATQTLAADAIGSFLLDTDLAVLSTKTEAVEVGADADGNPILENVVTQEGDIIAIAIRTDSPVNLGALSWNAANPPRSYYTASPDLTPESLTNPDGSPATERPIAPFVTLFSETDNIAPLEPWRATVSDIVELEPSIIVNDPLLTTQLWLTVKSDGVRVAKTAVDIVSGTATPVTVSFETVTDADYFIEISGNDPGLLARLGGASANITITFPDDTTEQVNAPVGLNAPASPSIVSQAYRGWRMFGYNGNRSRADVAISLTAGDLSPPTDAEFEAQQDEIRDAVASGDEAQLNAVVLSNAPKVFAMIPDAGQSRWTSGDENLWAEAFEVSASRFGNDYPSVPDPSTFANARAVSRLSETNTFGLFGGIPLGGLSGSVSGSRSETVSLMDFLDMNGDRFPDVVSSGRRVQFSPMIGGLQDGFQLVPNMGEYVRASAGTSSNVGLGGTFPTQEVDAKAAPFRYGGSGASGESGTLMRSIGLNGSLTGGDSNTSYDLRDMNADGLPDLITQVGNNIYVSFNLGYRFAPSELLGEAKISQGGSSSLSFGAGYNDGIYGFGGGVNGSNGSNSASDALTDINGDGLVDRVWRTATSSALLVQLNSGSGFEPEVVQWSTGGQGNRVSEGVSESEGGGVYFSFPICLLLGAPPCIIINPGWDTGKSVSRTEVSIQDMDGDGFPEYLTSSRADTLRVSLDTIERTNMLRQVNRPLGSTVSVSYERSGNTSDQPQNKWVMSRVEVFDGFAGDGTDILATNFAYEDGYWDREEREFFGYARVIEDHMDTSATGGEAIYRTITREFRNGNYYEKGLLAASTTTDADGSLYLETANTYDFVDITTGTPISEPDSLTATVFPQLIRTDNQFFEGQAVAGKATYMTYGYDALGNVVSYFDAANLDTTNDDVSSTITYHEDLAAYIMGKADSVTVTGLGGNGAGDAYRNREATFAPGTGNLISLTSILENGSSAFTDMSYDSFGNLVTVTGPANATGQRYALNYVFDNEVNTYVTGVTDSFGYTSAASYDVRFGAILSTRDLNDQPMTYTLDDVGRIVTVTGPYQAGSGFDTIRFAYNPRLDVPGDSQYPDVDVSWAKTEHIDVYRNIADPIETALFIDGLGRVLQTKKDAAIFESLSVEDRMVTSGRIVFDFLGRQTEQYYPVVENLGQAGTFNPTYDGIAPTLTDYDVLDRPVRVTIPDGSATVMAYGFGPDRSGTTQFRTLFTDAEGSQRETFADVRKLMTSVKEINPSGGQPTIWTSYNYDPLRQITDVTDDQGNVTRAEYDNFGRMTALDSPDMGRTTYRFDLASNLVGKQTANLAAAGTEISYGYDFNRLNTVTYPQFTENNVSYTYGGPEAAFNRANRIVSVSSEGGVEERFYGPLGELVKQVRTINSDTQGNSTNSPEVYTTTWIYDTWNRLQSMTYPDGEVLTNLYDSGGKLHQIDGEKTGYDYPYLRLMAYDKFGQRAFMRAGNNTETAYSYVPTTRRLDGLVADNAQGRTFQNLSYDYDLVGNITAQANATVVTGASELGGATSFTYQYDDLYRLTGATGVWKYAPGKTESFTLDMSYDSIHNIASKDQQHYRTQPSDVPIPQQKTTYDWSYSYAGPQPHAPSLIGNRAYSYDLNGNQLGWDHVSNGTRRTIVWDEENRIQEIADNGQTQAYKYDDAGERVIKRGPQGETAYVNQFWTVRNREVGTKHIFAGGTRMVSKLVQMPREGQAADALVTDCTTPWGWVVGNGLGLGRPRNPRFCDGTAGPEVFEKDQYYFHPDHLGSSSYVTDVEGEIYQHLEYFPFGETWIEESSNTQRTPYLFTGKELDEETGLYYFGARYYDPRTSVWQSPDPILATYLLGRRSGGGVFMPVNLNLYGYVQQRPVMMFDPDGEGAIGIGSGPEGRDWYSAEDQAAAAQAGAELINPIPSFDNLSGENGLGWQAFEIVTTLPIFKFIGDAASAAKGAARQSGDAAEVASTGTRQVDEAVDAVSPTARGRVSEARVLDDMDLPSNNQRVSTTEGNSVPDSLTPDQSVEIKDCIIVSCTKQVRIQTEAAEASGRQSVLVTGTNTHVTRQAVDAFDDIIRRDDLGPQ